MQNIPLKKAIIRAKAAYRLMQTRGLMPAELTKVSTLRGTLWCWSDRAHGTNLRDNGAFNHKEIAHGSV